VPLTCMLHGSVKRACCPAYACLQLTSDQLFEVYKGFIDKYPVVSIEDAFDQDDWPAWTKMNGTVSIQLVGYTFLKSLLLRSVIDVFHILNVGSMWVAEKRRVI